MTAGAAAGSWLMGRMARMPLKRRSSTLSLRSMGFLEVLRVMRKCLPPHMGQGGGGSLGSAWSANLSRRDVLGCDRPHSPFEREVDLSLPLSSHL